MIACYTMQSNESNTKSISIRYKINKTYVSTNGVCLKISNRGVGRQFIVKRKVLAVNLVRKGWWWQTTQCEEMVLTDTSVWVEWCWQPTQCEQNGIDRQLSVMRMVLTGNSVWEEMCWQATQCEEKGVDM